MSRIHEYYKLKSKIGNLVIDGLWDAQKLLGADIWNLTVLNTREKMIRIAAILLCDVISVKEYPDSVNSSCLAVEIMYFKTAPRKDNKQIFRNLYSYLKPAVHILVEKRYKINLLYLLSKWKRLNIYRKMFPNFGKINSMYISAQLLVANELKAKCSFLEDKKLLLIFQEDDLLSSTIVQMAQSKNICVVAPQHGMPLNRKEDIDQLPFDGFLADYKLLWSEAAKEQFLSAGIEDSRLVIVGNTKKMDDDVVTPVENNRVLGIILDCPDYEYAKEVNMKMLDFAKKLAKQNHLRIVVKVHPRDRLKCYRAVLKNEELLDMGTTMEEFEKMVSISIGHTSGAIFDLIYDGKIVFQYVDDKKYPVETLDICKFRNDKELSCIYQAWENDWGLHYKHYMEEVVPRYHTLNARGRHNEFFKKILGRLCDGISHQPAEERKI